MNPYILTRTMKIGFLYDGRPLQGLSSGTAGKGSFFLMFTHQSAAGASLRRQGAAAIIVSDGEWGKNSASYYDFHRKNQHW